MKGHSIIFTTQTVTVQHEREHESQLTIGLVAAYQSAVSSLRWALFRIKHLGVRYLEYNAHLRCPLANLGRCLQQQYRALLPGYIFPTERSECRLSHLSLRGG